MKTRRIKIKRRGEASADKLVELFAVGDYVVINYRSTELKLYVVTCVYIYPENGRSSYDEGATEFMYMKADRLTVTTEQAGQVYYDLRDVINDGEAMDEPHTSLSLATGQIVSTMRTLLLGKVAVLREIISSIENKEGDKEIEKPEEGEGDDEEVYDPVGEVQENEEYPRRGRATRIPDAEAADYYEDEESNEITALRDARLRAWPRGR